MKSVVDRIVTETLRLDACVAGEQIDIRFSLNGSWRVIGLVRLEKIKPIAKGMVQIKYRGDEGRGKVQKTDIPGDVVVTRKRKGTRADGPDAGVPERETFDIDGVRYQRVEPAKATDDGIEVLDPLPKPVVGEEIGKTTRSKLAGWPMSGEPFMEMLAEAARLSGGSIKRID